MAGSKVLEIVENGGGSRLESSGAVNSANPFQQPERDVAS